MENYPSMKVYLEAPEIASYALERVANNLRRYAPEDIEVVSTREEADVLILHVIGYPDVVELVEKYREKFYVILQYGIRTTQQPHTSSWLSLWRNALLVYSYYDIEQYCAEDETTLDDVNFYRAPLGVNQDNFYPRTTIPRNYTIFTSGYVAESEAVKECAVAAYRLRGKVFHLGPFELLAETLGPHVRFGLHISDEALAYEYSRCHYVAGLRRGEGFELPAAEGLLCGARPIMFDRPHYRDWFDGLAVFIEEGDFNVVTEQLEKIFRDKTGLPVTERDMAEARLRFNWKTFASGFWFNFSLACQAREFYAATTVDR
jgi:hypothetical protein